MVMLNGKEYTSEDIKILKEMADIFKNDPTSLTVTSQPLMGPYQANGGQYGLLSYPGLRPDMFTTIQRPYGLGRIVGVQRSTNANEKIAIITGATDGVGENAADYCGDPPVAGQLKRTVQNYIWGKWFMKTRLNVLPEMGETVDYADAATLSRNIINMQQANNPFMPDVMARLDLNRPDGLQLANELFNLGIALERSLARVEIRGNQALAPAATQLGFIREFNGLESQVITGRRDLDSQQLSPAADSTVIPWTGSVDTANTVGGRTFLQTIVDSVYAKIDLAERIGLGGMQFAFIGSSKLFHALTAIWACEYWTQRCANTAQTVDAGAIRSLQLQMMQGDYLLVDNVQYPYIKSDGIRSNRAAGNIWTDDNLFFIPVSYNGRRMLNMQYKPMDNADITDFSEFGGGSPIVKPLNGGMFLVGTRHNGFCAEHLLAAKFRMILDAPFLAFVINSIQYSYAAEYRDPYPGTTAHFNGGTTVWDGNMTVS